MSLNNEELIKDLIAREEWAVEYHKKELQSAQIKLNGLKMSFEQEQPVDLDKILAERRYPDV